MKKTTKIQVLFIASIILFPVIVQSMNMGTLVREDSATIFTGDEITFEVLFWNSGDPYYLKVSEKNIPNEWKVSIQPNNFILNKLEPAKPPFDKSEYINLPGIGIIKPSSVRINIQVPKNAQRGEYALTFTATTSPLGRDISTSQERDINFKIIVKENLKDSQANTKGSSESGSQINPKIIEQQKTESQKIDTKSEEQLQKSNETGEQQEEAKNPLTGMVTNIPKISKNTILITLFLVGIILISLVIYKHA
jgi:hypothetical protein